MPYTIRKQDCKQSDGDRGTYVLSYTDNKGKKHRNCHTSKKKAKGQIAAIEAEGVEEVTEGKTMKIKLSELRKIIREAIAEAKEEEKVQSAPSRPDDSEAEGMDEADMDESEFTYAIAKAAEKGQKTVDIDGEKFPVKMSKEKAKDITKNEKK